MSKPFGVFVTEDKKKQKVGLLTSENLYTTNTGEIVFALSYLSIIQACCKIM
jgi:hypothetical protein